MNANTASERADIGSSTLFRFRWWYKGRTLEGNIIKLEGHVMAKDSWEAAVVVEADQRKRWPDVKWMHDREVEDEGENEGFKFGPTIQLLKGRKSKSNV